MATPCSLLSGSIFFFITPYPVQGPTNPSLRLIGLVFLNVGVSWAVLILKCGLLYLTSAWGFEIGAYLF